jgi:hypothetical protein
MRLSPHFSLEEFTVSQEAVRLGINNDPPSVIVTNLQRLCLLVLEPLRDTLKAPLIVSSGYRCPELNRRINGAPGSAHMFGLAADIVCPGASARDICTAIVTLGLPFDQVIDEFSSWCHVSIVPENMGKKPRREVLEARRGGNGRTVYQAIKLGRQ